jgi:hypothetical protein
MKNVIMLPANEQMATFLASHTCTAFFHGSDGFAVQRCIAIVHSNNSKNSSFIVQDKNLANHVFDFINLLKNIKTKIVVCLKKVFNI